MSQDRSATLFFELFDGLPRQGPGDDASTLEALKLLPPLTATTRVLDIGCGTGRSTRVLARFAARAAAGDGGFADLVRNAPGLADAAALDELLDPANYLGAAGELVDRVLARKTTLTG